MKDQNKTTNKTNKSHDEGIQKSPVALDSNLRCPESTNARNISCHFYDNEILKI